MSNDMEKKLVARWESKSGKHWVEVYSYPDGGLFSYTAPDAGGVATWDRIEEMVKIGYFLPDAAKTPMHRVL